MRAVRLGETKESVWSLPDWAAKVDLTPMKCRSCGADVLWCVTRDGKPAPLNRDGVSHFATCPQADEWRRKT